MINEQYEIERSQQFFTDPSSFAAFDTDQRHRRIVGCIDPKDQDTNNLLTIVQTPGGAVGTGSDWALAETARSGEIVTVSQGIDAESKDLPFVKMGAHHICKFIGGITTVFGEMSDPSPFTEQGVQHLINRYSLQDVITPRLLVKVQDAAKKLQECEYKEEELLNKVNSLEPTKNVVTMSGKNTAQIYIWNHHPDRGLNRHKKHRETGIKVQGYHDSIGATIKNLAKSKATSEQRRYTLGAHILKAPATRSVIGDSQTIHYEVLPSESGLRVVEMDKNN